MTARRAAGLSLALCIALVLPSVVLLILEPERSVPDDLFGGVAGVSFLLLALAFATVGAIVTARVPANRIGWLFCLTGLLTAATLLAYHYANYGLHATSQPLPGVTAAAWFATVPSAAVAGLLGLTLLLFPNGRLPSRRWRPAAAMSLLGMALLVVGTALRPGAIDVPFAAVSNPLGLPGAGGVMDAVNTMGWILVMGGIMLGGASMLVRLRRARGVERRQLTLVLAVGAVVATATLLSMVTWYVGPESLPLQTRMAVIGTSFAIFPMAVGVAILRYRLYDIDVVINRTLVYGALTATLAATYLGSVLLLQLLLSPVTQDSGLAVAVSTLTVAALFRPVRSRIQAIVDRRFYRRRYDSAQTLQEFGARLRNELDIEALTADLRAVVRETMQPAHVSLWLRKAGR